MRIGAIGSNPFAAFYNKNVSYLERQARNAQTQDSSLEQGRADGVPAKNVSDTVEPGGSSNASVGGAFDVSL